MNVRPLVGSITEDTAGEYEILEGDTVPGIYPPFPEVYPELKVHICAGVKAAVIPVVAEKISEVPPPVFKAAPILERTAQRAGCS